MDDDPPLQIPKEGNPIDSLDILNRGDVDFRSLITLREVLLCRHSFGGNISRLALLRHMAVMVASKT